MFIIVVNECMDRIMFPRKINCYLLSHNYSSCESNVGRKLCDGFVPEVTYALSH